MAMGRLVVPTVIGAKKRRGIGNEVPERHAEAHGGEDPDRQVTVEERHVLEDAGLHIRLLPSLRGECPFCCSHAAMRRRELVTHRPEALEARFLTSAVSGGIRQWPVQPPGRAEVDRADLVGAERDHGVDCGPIDLVDRLRAVTRGVDDRSRPAPGRRAGGPSRVPSRRSGPAGVRRRAGARSPRPSGCERSWRRKGRGRRGS